MPHSMALEVFLALACIVFGYFILASAMDLLKVVWAWCVGRWKSGIHRLK